MSVSTVSVCTNQKQTVLPECLCNLELPHHSDHAENIPPQVMPSLHFPTVAEKQVMPSLQFPIKAQTHANEKEKRLEELLTDFSHVRAQDAEIAKKFEKEAEQILTDLRGEYRKTAITDLWQPKRGTPIEDGGVRLKLELEHSRFQLADLRNQMHTLKRELSLYRRTLRHEVGGGYDLEQVLANDKWKGRAEEIERLKGEIGALESKAYSYKYRKNPITIPQYNPQFPRVEDLIPKRQVETLKKEAGKKEGIAKEKDKDLSVLIHEYGDLSLMYKANATHNKILAEELRSLKQQLVLQETKAKEDLDLIRNLTQHQIQMKELLEREAHLANMVDKKQFSELLPEKEEQIDTQKFKTLWQVSEYQKQSLLEMVKLMTDRLDDVMHKTEEAERHCLDNQSRQKELEEHLKEQKEAAGKKGGKKDHKPKAGASSGKEFPIETEIKVVQEENDFLKSFLQKTLETKEEDLKLYRLTINSVRAMYVESLENLKIEKEKPPEIPHDPSA